MKCDGKLKNHDIYYFTRKIEMCQSPQSIITHVLINNFAAGPRKEWVVTLLSNEWFSLSSRSYNRGFFLKKPKSIPFSHSKKVTCEDSNGWNLLFFLGVMRIPNCPYKRIFLSSGMPRTQLREWQDQRWERGLESRFPLVGQRRRRHRRRHPRHQTQPRGAKCHARSSRTRNTRCWALDRWWANMAGFSLKLKICSIGNVCFYSYLVFFHLRSCFPIKTAKCDSRYSIKYLTCSLDKLMSST